MSRASLTDLHLWQCPHCGGTNSRAIDLCRCGVWRDAQRGPARTRATASVSTSGGGAVWAGRATTGQRRGTVGREAELQRACEQWLTSRGIEYLHLSHRAREHKGWPDLTFAVAGVPCAVELKNATGVVTADQETCLARLAYNGWRVSVQRGLREFCEWVDAVVRQATEG